MQASLTGGNRNDVTQLMPVIQDIPPVRGCRGRPRRPPDTVYADRADDHDKYRKQVRAVGVTPVIARRGTEHGSGLGQYRWVVEQTFALLHWFRRLRIRWEIRDDIHEAFLRLACAIICLRRLTSLSPLLGVHLPGFRSRIDRMLGRSPGECRKGQHAPTWRKAADDQLAAYTDVPADQKHQAVEPLGVCTSGSLTSGSKDDAEAPKATGEPVPSPEQDKAEVVRAVLTRREIGVVTSAAAETARDHCHATLLLWPGGRNPTATHFHSAGGSRCGTRPWRRHRQRGIR